MTLHARGLQTVTLRDARTLEFRSISEDSPVVVFHHGSPGSSFASPSLLGAAAERGLRVVAASRPGYGGSSRDEGRAVAAAASDTVELLDALGVEHFATIGWSGGGPHALACAALSPGRCVAALSVAGVAPYLPEEFDWTEGMGPENMEEFALGLEGGAAYDKMLATYRASLLALRPEDARSARELFGELVSDADEAATPPEAVAFTLRNIAHGLAHGVEGWRDDDQAFLSDWGVELGAMPTPVGVWFGGQDLMVPLAHGEWLAANVRGARATRLDDEGHLSLIVTLVPRMLDELIELAGGRW